MPDLSITAGNVAPGNNASIAHGTAGATITAGQAVYFDESDSKYKLADCDSASAAARSPAGIALNAASDDQPIAVLKSGRVTIGATLTAGVAYYLSATAGGICPVGDLSTGDYPVLIGIAESASVLKVQMLEAGVALS